MSEGTEKSERPHGLTGNKHAWKGGTASAKMNVPMGAERIARIEAAAKAAGVGKAEWIRRAVDAALEKK